MKRNAEKSMKKYLNRIKGGLMEFQRKQYHELIYTKKELGYKLKHGIKNTGIEDYKDIVIVHDSK